MGIYSKIRCKTDFLQYNMPSAMIISKKFIYILVQPLFLILSSIFVFNYLNLPQKYFLTDHPIIKILFLTLLLNSVFLLFHKLLISPKKSLILIFVVAFLLRLYFILITPNYNNWIDLSIYRSSGRLISNGINPYDFQGQIKLREKIRIDLMKDYKKDSWNNYISGNLPLSQIYYGLIERISPTPEAYRLIFNAFDSLLVVLIFLFTQKFWQIQQAKKSNLFYTLIFLLPVTLVWGTILPEDKGLQILFMIGTVYLANSRSTLKKILISPILLSFAVTFKLYGIFLIPICLYYLIKNTKDNSLIKKLADSVIYIFVFLVSNFIILFPHLKYINSFLIYRLYVENSLPTNASALRLFYLLFGSRYIFAEYFLIGVYLIFAAYYLFKVKNKILFLTMIVFLLLLIINKYGSLDRMNILILTTILLSGVLSAKLGIYTMYIYGIFGVSNLFVYLYAIIERIPMQNYQVYESLFVLYFVLIFPLIFSKLYHFHAKSIIYKRK